MHTVPKPTALLLILLLIALYPTAVSASSFEFTVTAKSAFDKMKAAADKATTSKLTSQYTALQTVQKQTIQWDTKINDLHYRNEDAELTTRQRIKEVDANKLRKLEADVSRAKKQYQPLFNHYDTIRQQLSIAKSYQSKTLVSILNPQVETTKAAVQIAKQDIRSKEAALKAAKATATKTMKRIKDILIESDKVNIKIRSAKSAISTQKKQFTTETKILNQVVRKGDATATLSSFTRLISFTKQVNEQKQKIFAYEQQISSVIAKANVQLSTQ
ncbi:hypothetical protein [Paenibacillus sp. sgz302251]|uniref:hypothetical protein n=1 Tax=Paenibacillus sp. sgz302251 TaxID=3414493 RepID=UPI003C7DB1A2